MTSFASVLILSAVLSLGLGVETATQEEPVPETIRPTIRGGQFGQLHEISYRVNPFYLGGDFNGDGRPDHADRTESLLCIP